MRCLALTGGAIRKAKKAKLQAQNDPFAYSKSFNLQVKSYPNKYVFKFSKF